VSEEPPAAAPAALEATPEPEPVAEVAADPVPAAVTIVE